MIRYTLTCAEGHAFDSWFKSADAFETVAGAGMVACPDCGNTQVTKSLMAPAVRPARKAAASQDTDTGAGALSAARTDTEKALAELRRKIEENSDYVGMNFATEARRIHDGEAPERSIFGEARPDDAKALIEDGIPVAPLPFVPKSKTN